ncbi:flavin reductase [Halopseudomonas sp. Lyrl_26]|uniref:p-hydroxyphenylacetate 3-hydroxylase reductase component n=1 Tax=Halopseudomonas sp. Lyrl_26 TaxID=3110923 RepID=UPI003F7D894F
MENVQPTLDPRQLRRALGNFACGVTIVTACDADGRKVGVTANSFNSVSLDPPLILWSLDKRSSAWNVFQQAEHFAVNILASNQIELSNHFARPQEDKFSGIEHLSGVGGAPIFHGCAGNFQCATYQHIDAGDHWLIIGQVEHFEDFSQPPLAYHQGSYAMVLPHPRGRKPEVIEHNESADLLHTRLGDNLFYLMIQAVSASHPRFVQQHLKLGMRNSESRLLLVLDSAPNASAAELQQAVAIPARELADAMQNLQLKGYLDIKGNQRWVTSAGHAKLQELWNMLHQAQDEIFAELSEGELEVFKKALKLVVSKR